MAVVINDRTREAVKKIRKLSFDGLTDFTEKVVDIAKTGSPYQTGNNRDLVSGDVGFSSGASIDQILGGGGRRGNLGDNRKVKKTSSNTFGARVYTRSGYGAFLELGTAHMAARPYISKGVGQAIREFNDGKKWS